MDLRLFCLFLVCLSLCCLVNGYEIRDITAKGSWKKIFEGVNSDTAPKIYTVKYFLGLKTDQTDERTVTIKGSGPSLNGWTEGDRLEIASIQSPELGTIKKTDIHRQSEQTLSFTIQPGQKVVKWQFAIDIAGNEYSHNMIQTYANDDVPKDFDAKVTVLRRRLIQSGISQIQINHKRTNRYLNIVERERWPAATTGVSRCYNFVLWDYGKDGVVIRTHNSMYQGFEYLSVWPENWSNNGGWIYASTFDNIDAKRGIYWSVSKPSPLYDGDTVTFKSQLYPDVYLCRTATDDAVTDVIACKTQPDEWVLRSD